jgi:hypothetical protein
MNDIVLVQIVDCLQNLLDGLRAILLGELALLADSVEQLSSSRKLGDDVVLVPRLEPVHKLDNVRVVEALQHVQLVKDHALIAPDDLLQDDLDGDPAVGALSLPDDAIRAGTQGAPKPVLGPGSRRVSSMFCKRGEWWYGGRTSSRSSRVAHGGG